MRIEGGDLGPRSMSLKPETSPEVSQKLQKIPFGGFKSKNYGDLKNPQEIIRKAN